MSLRNGRPFKAGRKRSIASPFSGKTAFLSWRGNHNENRVYTILLTLPKVTMLAHVGSSIRSHGGRSGLGAQAKSRRVRTTRRARKSRAVSLLGITGHHTTEFEQRISVRVSRHLDTTREGGLPFIRSEERRVGK